MFDVTGRRGGIPSDPVEKRIYAIFMSFLRQKSMLAFFVAWLSWQAPFHLRAGAPSTEQGCRHRPSAGHASDPVGSACCRCFPSRPGRPCPPVCPSCPGRPCPPVCPSCPGRPRPPVCPSRPGCPSHRDWCPRSLVGLNHHPGCPARQKFRSRGFPRRPFYSRRPCIPRAFRRSCPPLPLCQ